MSAEIPTWEELYRLLPEEFHPYALELEWDRRLLWELELPVERMTVADLEWQLTLPWWRDGDRYFCVRPADVLESPGSHTEQLRRTMEADLAYPLDVTPRNDRWFILDGVHRLLKAAMLDVETVQVRKVRAGDLEWIGQALEAERELRAGPAPEMVIRWT